MKTRFDWQTDEESEFDQTGLTEQTSSSGGRPGCLITSLIVVTIVIISAVWLFHRRQADTIRRINEDVLLAYELQQQAAINDDKELFSATLSPRDRTWKREQERLLAANLFNDRAEIGFAADFGARTQTAIELSPDLQRAELSYVQTYSTDSDSRSDSAIELAHTLVFQLEEDRWMNAPPDNAFWGKWQHLDRRLFSITYPDRDAELARRLSDEIGMRLSDLCRDLDEEDAYGMMLCEATVPWRIKLSTDVEALLKYAGTPSSASVEYDFELPAPTLLGVPQYERDYDTYLQTYTAPLMHSIREMLLSTTLLPEQKIYALCFDHPLDGRYVYRYEWMRRSWQSLLPFQTFIYLSALPDDSAVLFFDGDVLTIFHANRDAETAGRAEIWQRALPLTDSQRLIGWTFDGEAPRHLVQQTTDNAFSSVYQEVDFRNCNPNRCWLSDLPGFPSWSPAGDAAIYLNGPEIFVEFTIGNQPRREGTGFAPFWLNSNTFGYVRFTRRDTGNAVTEVVASDLEGDQMQVLFDGDDLAEAAGIDQKSVLFVNYVIPNPDDHDILILSATGIRNFSGQYFIFTADISEREHDKYTPQLTLQLMREGSQGGVPGLLMPTGPAPFLVSPNGRWLTMTELSDQIEETWTILIHDLSDRTSHELSKNVPAMPGNFPLLDWSTDGQWLVVVDRQYLHLVAPELEHEEIIAHNFDACSHIAWAD